MILAAGLGTRLRPLTDTRPKALIEVGGKPLLAHVIQTLKAAGVDQIIINVHHFADQIIDFVQARQHFGIRIEFSREEELLDTGGGLKKASWFLQGTEPFILHNVDVLSRISLQDMLEHHHAAGALATLAVRDRATSRYLLFDEHGRLVGWKSLQQGTERIVRPLQGKPLPLSFLGIHVISPRIFSLMTESGRFSIIDAYLRLAKEGENIAAYRDDRSFWLDLGRPENLIKAEEILSGE